MPRAASRVGILGALVVLGAGLILPWLISAPNPVALGSKLIAKKATLAMLIGLWPAGASIPLLALVGLGVALLARDSRHHLVLAMLGAVGILLVCALGDPLILAGQQAGWLHRVVLWSSGAWLGLAGFALMFYGGLLRLQKGGAIPGPIWVLIWLPILAALGLAAYTVWSGSPTPNLILASFQRELQSGGLQLRLGQHLWLAGAGVFLSVVLGVLLGIWGYYNPRVGQVALYLSGVVLTIPSLALFTMLMDPYSVLAQHFPVLRQYGVAGLGPAPAITGLTLYGLLPVIRNTYVGLRGVPVAQVDAAVGMGMTPGQVLLQVLLPRAFPVIMAGIRSSAVMLIGIATLAQLIGAGGLGYYILSGINRSSVALILLGAIPAVVLAYGADMLLQAIGRWLTPRGLRLLREVTA
jgi:osmoprotectant transport system permease protein